MKPTEHRLASMTLGLAAVAALCVGDACGPRIPTQTNGADRDEGAAKAAVTILLFGYGPRDVRPTRSPGRFGKSVFLVRYDPANPDRVEWVDCPIATGYHFVPHHEPARDLRIDNENDLRTLLPLSVASFAATMAQGNRILVRYETVGYYELDSRAFLVPVEGACGQATHFVERVRVGGYEVAALSGAAAQTGQDPSDAGGGSRADDAGLPRPDRLSACQKEAVDAPPAGCHERLEIVLTPIGWRRADALARPAAVP